MSSIPPHPDVFVRRHIGPAPADRTAMLDTLGYESLDALAEAVVPAPLRSERPLDLPAPLSEPEALAALRAMADANHRWQSHLGMGYYGTLTPPVIRRNVLENPAWYTPYTPYQP